MAYTDIDDPSAHFHTQIWTGNSGYDVNVVNNANAGNFKPDLIWAKDRVNAYNHNLVDSSRGVTKTLWSDTNAAEMTASQSNYDTKSFNTNGFTTQAPEYTNSLGGNNNANGKVGWQWKANGGSLTTVGESGSNPGFTRQTNTDAGFSIIAYTGTGSNGTIAHGLPSTPEMIIFKRRNNANVWATWHQGIGDDYKLVLNSTDAKDSDGAFMNSTLPTSSNITVGGASVNTNADNGTYICYAFSPVQGYSKFGSYVGNGNADGAFVYLGFKPAFVMLKPTTFAEEWAMIDTKRNPFNQAMKQLKANSDGAEYDGASVTNGIDILSNGFKVRTSRTEINATTHTYIYMAFAENPFTTSTGVPATAR